MCYTCMFSGLNIWEIDRRYYHPVEQFSQCKTLFQLLEERGYETHVIWDKKWMSGSYRHSRVYSENTVFHPLNVGQPVGPHRRRGKPIAAVADSHPVDDIVSETEAVLDRRKRPVFLWVHCPHVFLGKTGYGSDIDLFDELAGRLREMFSDGRMYLTGDHGHYKGERDKVTYGFDVYEGAIAIPLITPNHFGAKTITTPLSSIQIKNLILDKELTGQEFLYCDTQYYYQPFRRLMIRKGNYKYIYNKFDRSEELYDLARDPAENTNLLIADYYDCDRNTNYYLDEVYYYPDWTAAESGYRELRAERERVWRQEKKLVFLLNLARKAKKNGLRWSARTIGKARRARPGRWGALVRTDLG